MTVRRPLLAPLALGLALAIGPAGISEPRPGTEIAPTAPLDTDPQFSLLEEAQFRLWRKGWLPLPANRDPAFRFLLRMLAEDTDPLHHEWIDEKTDDWAITATEGGSLISSSGQTIHEPDPTTAERK